MGGLFGSPKPPPPPQLAPPPPLPDQGELDAAKQRAIAQQQTTSGRMSTIMSNAPGDAGTKLGG